MLIQESGAFGDVEITNEPRSKRKRRSFTPYSAEAQRTVYLSGKRVGPKPLKYPLNEDRDLLFADCEKDYFIWNLLRWKCSLHQVIPSWTGFNIVVHEGVPVLKSSVHYLDCIDAPATEISTIYQVCNMLTSLLYV